MHTRYSRHAAHAHCCSGCGHPISHCTCHMRCRTVDRELLADAVIEKESADGTIGANLSHSPQTVLNIMRKIDLSDFATATADSAKAIEIGASQVNTMTDQFELLRKMIAAGRISVGENSAIIGGLCCVKLSVEYMPIIPINQYPSLVAIAVMDSEGTMMAWGKLFMNGEHQYKEAVMTVNPGARLVAIAVNAVCRVRWCETISC